MKYRIVNTEILKSRQCSNLDEYVVLLKEAMLSDEETLEVFKSCYDMGYETGASTYNDDYHGIPIEFDELKKSL